MMKKLLFGMFLLVSVLFLNALSQPSLSDKKKKKTQTSPEIIETNIGGKGVLIEIEFIVGKSHNHPLMVIWAEDTAGNYIQTLYVAESVGKGFFKYGDSKSGKWKPGEIRRPAALPYWSHKRKVKESDSLYIPTSKTPISDAYTGATPKADFILKTKTDEDKYRFINIFFEINQSWDWNQYWTNNKYPDDKDYLSSSQPAVVYSAAIDLKSHGAEYFMKLIGRSSHSGNDGKLYTDLNTMTTALKIASKIVVRVK